MVYSIDKFWKSIITTSDKNIETNVPGWFGVSSQLSTYVEAPITLSSDYDDADPSISNIILVSAPGAVGKTTLARQIAAVTGAVFIDLSQAEPVGANTLVGGLASSDLYDDFKRGDAAVVIDGLDEARMRVTQEGMAAFMKDVVNISAQNRNPIILLGRTGAIQEAWLWLSEESIKVPVLEIGYFENEQAAEFVKTQIKHIREEETRREPDGRAVDMMLERLRENTLKDGGTFSGYSPVLVAIAKRIADPEDVSSANTQKLIAKIQKGEEVFTLDGIIDEIMKREQFKLSRINFDDSSLKDFLYSPKEQLARLVMRIYGGGLSIKLPTMSIADQDKYNNALPDWLADHPFLDGEGKEPSSAVFAGLMAAHALQNTATEQAVLKTELGRLTAVNPFLAEFYVPLLKSGTSLPRVPTEHLGVLYSSIRARLAIGEGASLLVDGDDNDDSYQAEITFSKREKVDAQDSLKFEIDPSGVISFGPYIEDIDISAPRATVSIGFGSEAVLVAPIYIETEFLVIETSRMIVENSPQKQINNLYLDSVQFLANEADVDRIATRPVRRGDVLLEINWPGAENFPWTDYAVSSSEVYDDRTEEALRRLKKILRLFRSHSKGQLAKFRAAIDHRRRTQGVGKCVLDQLQEEGILTISGPMYFLHADSLAKSTGLNFHDVRSTRVHKETIEFVQRALNRT